MNTEALINKYWQEVFNTYRPVSDEELTSWGAENIDKYYYKHSFECYKEFCKQTFDIEVTEEDFEKFKTMVREEYNIHENS